MKTITLHNTNLSVPEIGMGCMRINSLETADAVKEWIDTALAHDINFFDHADIYAKGQCEELFGKAMTPSLRDQIILQSKCAIRPGIAFDFSKEHILFKVLFYKKRCDGIACKCRRISGRDKTTCGNDYICTNEKISVFVFENIEDYNKWRHITKER